VAVVNETFARRFFGNQPPIGRTFRTRPEPDYPATLYQVVGVIKDTRYYDLREAAPAICYAAAAQYPPGGTWSDMYVRSPLTREALTAAIQKRIGGSHPEITVDVRGFQQIIDDSLVRERLLAILSGSFGALAGLLAAIGLYGLLAYLTVRRRSEIGIRMALGASRRRIIGLVLKEAALLLIAGSVVGLLVTMGLERAAGSLLFGLQPRDPLTYWAAVGALAAAGALGGYLPARRASRLDPMDALRCE
jgi:ABC-type antimicrobial peptide transport system permease subunit